MITGVWITGTYSINAKMETNDGLPGESKNCKITLSGGQINLGVDVDIVGVDKSGSVDFSLPFGEYKKVTVPGTLSVLKVRVKTTATVKDIAGSNIIDINTNSLSFNSEGTKNIAYSVMSNAELDETFTISANVELKINIEVYADPPFLDEYSIASGSLPVSTMSPTMSATGTVKEQKGDNGGGFSFDLNNPIFLLLIVIIVIVIVVAIAAAAYKKNKPKKKPVSRQKKAVAHTPVVKPDPKIKEFKAIEEEDKTFEEEVEKIKKSKKEQVEKLKTEKKTSTKSKTEEKKAEPKKRRNFCPKCGNKLGGFPSFCGRCGYKF